MIGHDIIAIGSSAGGIKALSTIITNLPADINPAIFIVQHLSANSPSYLPEILGDVGSLPLVHPADEGQFQIVKSMLRPARKPLRPADGTAGLQAIKKRGGVVIVKIRGRRISLHAEAH